MTYNRANIMIIAGEMSGDGHAAKLVKAIGQIAPQTEFFGCAGQKMRENGVRAIVQSDDLSIIGLPEVALALPKFINIYWRLVKSAEKEKPDIVVLVDFPEFNLKLAKSLKKCGFKVVYFISPQLWAWRKYRLRTISKYVDLLISILPFEKEWYFRHGVKHVEYVGSPLAGEVRPAVIKQTFCEKHAIDPARRIISLLPGSRHKEIVKILPDQLKTAALMLKHDATIQFIVAFASERNMSELSLAKDQLSGEERRLIADIRFVFGETYDALNASDAAAVTSGTATLETGIIGTPMAVVYKTSGFNYRIIRPLIDVEHFGLINLIAGERIVKELMQDDFTPETLANELFRLLEPRENAAVRTRLKAAADKLGDGGASKRAAEAVLKLIEN